MYHSYSTIQYHWFSTFPSLLWRSTSAAPNLPKNLNSRLSYYYLVHVCIKLYSLLLLHTEVYRRTAKGQLIYCEMSSTYVLYLGIKGGVLMSYRTSVVFLEEIMTLLFVYAHNRSTFCYIFTSTQSFFFYNRWDLWWQTFDTQTSHQSRTRHLINRFRRFCNNHQICC